MIAKKGVGLFLRLLNAFGFENLKRKLHQILVINLNLRQSMSGFVIRKLIFQGRLRKNFN
jgi:hypothetical protein